MPFVSFLWYIDIYLFYVYGCRGMVHKQLRQAQKNQRILCQINMYLRRTNSAYSTRLGNRPYLLQVRKRVLKLLFCWLEYRSFRGRNKIRIRYCVCHLQSVCIKKRQSASRSHIYSSFSVKSRTCKKCKQYIDYKYSKAANK